MQWGLLISLETWSKSAVLEMRVYLPYMAYLCNFSSPAASLQIIDQLSWSWENFHRGICDRLLLHGVDIVHEQEQPILGIIPQG